MSRAAAEERPNCFGNSRSASSHRALVVRSPWRLRGLSCARSWNCSANSRQRGIEDINVSMEGGICAKYAKSKQPKIRDGVISIMKILPRKHTRSGFFVVIKALILLRRFMHFGGGGWRGGTARWWNWVRVCGLRHVNGGTVFVKSEFSSARQIASGVSTSQLIVSHNFVQQGRTRSIRTSITWGPNSDQKAHKLTIMLTQIVLEQFFFFLSITSGCLVHYCY